MHIIDGRLNHITVPLKKKSQLIWEIHILFQRLFQQMYILFQMDWRNKSEISLK